MMDSRTTESTRARPLAVEARQDMILAVVIPLIIEKGRDITSREIAEACGIAEGTIFRAFGDKESLVAAAIEKYLDPEQLRTNLRSISPDLPLETKLHAVFGLLVDRFTGVIRLMAALKQRPPIERRDPTGFVGIIDELLAPNRDELRVSAETVAQYARVVAFASSLPTFGESIPLTSHELVELMLHGMLEPAASTTTTSATTTSTGTRA